MYMHTCHKLWRVDKTPVPSTEFARARARMVPIIFYGSSPGRLTTCESQPGNPKGLLPKFVQSHHHCSSPLLRSPLPPHTFRRSSTHATFPKTRHARALQYYDDCAMKICGDSPLRSACIGLATSLLILTPPKVSAIPKAVRTQSNLGKMKSICMAAED